MSYAMTHLALAKEVNDSIGIATDLPQFLLGAIAPDSVHFRENYHGDMKKKSHYCPSPKPWGKISSEEECEEWLNYVLPKLKISEDQPHSDFYWGCLVHILSDIWNTREHFIHYSEWCARENVPKDAYYNEQKHNDIEMFNTVAWRDDVWMLLFKARGESVGSIIKASEVEKFRVHAFNLCNDGAVEPNYSKVFLTLNDNIRFIKSAAKEISALITSAK